MEYALRFLSRNAPKQQKRLSKQKIEYAINHCELIIDIATANLHKTRGVLLSVHRAAGPVSVLSAILHLLFPLAILFENACCVLQISGKKRVVCDVLFRNEIPRVARDS